jgi:hypothetical protein
MKRPCKTNNLRRAIGLIAILACGCQAARPAFDDSRASRPTRVILAADVADAAQTPPSTSESKPSAAPQSEKEASEDQKPAAQTPRYTAPGLLVQQATLLAVGVTTTRSTTAELSQVGKEASEARGSLPALGRAGITTAQPIAGGVVASRPGLQQGSAAGLGAASRFNIFSLQRNPLSGSTGRCQELASAGFFGRDSNACVRHFTRR